MKMVELKANKIARPQESQSFTAYTITKEQYDSWEWFFLWNFDTIKRTNTLASGSIRSRAFYASRSRKFSKKKVCLNRLEMLWNA